MSACDTCRDPGHCCRAIPLSQTFPHGMTREEVREHVRKGTDPWGNGRYFQPLPTFEPLRRIEHVVIPGEPAAEAPHGAKWLFNCEALSPEGRCTIYDRRPTLCEKYEPKTDTLCAEFDGPWEQGYLKVLNYDPRRSKKETTT